MPTKSDISMYELFTGKLTRRLKGHYGKVTSCVTSARDIEMYSSGTDCNVLLWQPEIKVIIIALLILVHNIDARHWVVLGHDAFVGI